MTEKNIGYVSKVETILQFVDKQLAKTGNADIKLSKEYISKLRIGQQDEIKWETIPGFDPIVDCIDKYDNPEANAEWIRQYIYRKRRDLRYLFIFAKGEFVYIKSPDVDRIRDEDKRKLIYGK